MLKRSWTWFRWTIFCLRQRRKADDASDLRTVSERSWLRQLLSTFYDRDKKPPQDKHFPSSVLRRSYLSDLKHRKGVFVWKRDHPTSNIKLKFNINTQGISKTYSEICLHKKPNLIWSPFVRETVLSLPLPRSVVVHSTLLAANYILHMADFKFVPS